MKNYEYYHNKVNELLEFKVHNIYSIDLSAV